VDFVLQAIQRGKLRPSIGAVYALEDYQQVFADQMNTSSRRGKIVVKS
jgi:NADPH:quinone reductase-like Zn-dependent oxidoreductase